MHLLFNFSSRLYKGSWLTIEPQYNKLTQGVGKGVGKYVLVRVFFLCVCKEGTGGSSMHTLFHSLREKYIWFYRGHLALYKDNVFLCRCHCMDVQHSMGPTQAAKMGEGSL